MINRVCLKNPKDWWNDDHGSFENKGYSDSIVTTNNEEVVLAERLARRKDERQFLEQGQYLTKTRYWTHRKYIEFKGKTVVVTNWKNEVEPLGMVKYVFEESPIMCPLRNMEMPKEVSGFIQLQKASKIIS